ncbi:unnamed protein product [Cercopithifilaria johnstoni]|uniref:Uncharacterized protein n=1 Tax=Cercopithifilaria johnstoni TaxID=2874296 RepID=A0A8J2LUX4_9BILA|nr:unnamed protein product [Cercopithifilaria johnstoni]
MALQCMLLVAQHKNLARTSEVVGVRPICLQPIAAKRQLKTPTSFYFTDPYRLLRVSRLLVVPKWAEAIEIPRYGRHNWHQHHCRKEGRERRVATQHKTQTLLKWEKQDIPNGTLPATK